MAGVYDRIQGYLPMFLIIAITVTVYFQLFRSTITPPSDLDTIIIFISIIIIAVFAFVYVRKFNNFPLELGLALFIYALIAILVQKLTGEFSPLQKILFSLVLLLGVVSIAAGIFRARDLQENRIGQLSRQKAELSRMSADLEQANMKLRLLSQITRHDINNQLTVLQGYLRLLKKKQPEIAENEYFQKAVISAQRISSTITFTRDYESIGVTAAAWQDCHALVDIAREQVSSGTVLVKNEIPAGFEIFADPLVVKVFYNLLDNAVRYGGKITTIRFFVQDYSDDLLIICEDDGNGISATEKELIFERGFGKNTGLGLTMSRDILAITGITLCETGMPGTGARFEISVPREAFRVAWD